MMKWEMGDPALVAQRRQEQEAKKVTQAGKLSCDGCQYRAKVWGIEYCINEHSKAGKANMVRCNNFKEVANV